MLSWHCVVQIDFCKGLIFSGFEEWIDFCSEKNGPWGMQFVRSDLGAAWIVITKTFPNPLPKTSTGISFVDYLKWVVIGHPMFPSWNDWIVHHEAHLHPAMPRNIITGLSILSAIFLQMVRSRCWGVDRSVDVHSCWPLLILHELHSLLMSKDVKG